MPPSRCPRPLLWVAIVALAITLFPRALFAQGKVTLTTPKLIYGSGGPISITIHNGSSGPITLPGCGAIIFERFNGEGFVPMPPPSCESLGPGETIPKGESLEIEVSPRIASQAYLRVALTYGVGCRSGLPLEQAECRSLQSARSRYVGYWSARSGG